MSNCDDIVEQWFTKTVQIYPGLMSEFLRTEKDPFRNPVGHALRTSMPTLVQEIFGEMNRERLSQALDDILRIRAVQDLSPSEAVGFIFLLRTLLQTTLSIPSSTLEERVDQLALMAFDQYMQCREQVAQVRANEVARRSSPRRAVSWH